MLRFMMREDLSQLLIRKKNHTRKLTGYFEIITSAALTKDQKIIDILLQKSFFTLDVKMGFHFGLISPAGYLELLGEHEAADFLRMNGADVDYLAFGAALAGNRGRAEYYRKYHGGHTNHIARGAAFAGDYAYVEELKNKHGASNAEILLGFVLGERTVFAKYFINIWEYKIYPKFLNHLLKSAGIVSGNLSPEVNEILQKFDFLNSEDIELEIKNIFYGAGLSGSYNIKPGLKELYSEAFYYGAIEGGHLDEVPSEFFKPRKIHNFDNMIDLQPAMIGCNIDYLERCHDVSLNNHVATRQLNEMTIYQCSESNDIRLMISVPKASSYLYDMIKYGFKIYDFPTLLEYPTYKSLSYIYEYRNRNVFRYFNAHDFLYILPNEEIATQLLAFDRNENFMSALLTKFITYNWENPVYKRYYYDFKKVYLTSQKIKTLMDKYNFNYDQAFSVLTNTDIRTYLFNSCKDVTVYVRRDICAQILSELGCLSLPDASNLIEKLRYFRHTIQDILNIANDLHAYANTHQNFEAHHASSLALEISKTRNNTDALHLLSGELEMIDHANTLAHKRSQESYPMLLRSASTFFNVAKRKVVELLESSSTPSHKINYDGSVDGKYEAMIIGMSKTISSKII